LSDNVTFIRWDNDLLNRVKTIATPISYKKYNEPASQNKWTYTRRIQAIRELHSSKYRICSLHISLLNDVTVSFVLNARSTIRSQITRIGSCNQNCGRIIYFQVRLVHVHLFKYLFFWEFWRRSLTESTEACVFVRPTLKLP